MEYEIEVGDRGNIPTLKEFEEHIKERAAELGYGANLVWWLDLDTIKVKVTENKVYGTLLKMFSAS